ncbi:hypothetical protein PSTT_07764 [Puccinia striiformis]|uniref:DUF4218 domain-containing protein n=1 Tax=Puccinia striiformis TaxID=27350 RepID=A0A2S4VF46_9BASI|nr:hypothetical protein PSTT_07764 [Puccinia striiformis]
MSYELFNGDCKITTTGANLEEANAADKAGETSINLEEANAINEAAETGTSINLEEADPLDKAAETGASNNNEKAEESVEETEDSFEDTDELVCGAILFKKSGSTRKPIRKFATQDLVAWLARLFCRENIEEALEQTARKSRSAYDDSLEMLDIHDSPVWRDFCGADGKQFTANSGNVTFSMFTDGINPHGNRVGGKHISVTFIIMVCLSLPVALRYRPENIFLVGIAPGPREPSLEQTNFILKPVVDQLRMCWSPGVYLSKTLQRPKGRLVSAALLPFFADLPALRRSLGFASHSAKRMCSSCLLPKSEINNIDPKTWPLRTLEEHRTWAKKSQEAKSIDERLEILDDHGVRYLILLELPYWNIVDYHVVDSMHNLLLGLPKWHCQRFWLMADKDDEPKPGKGARASKKGAQASKHTDADAEEQVAFRDLLLGSSTDLSDAEFVPNVASAEWGGEWVPPSEGKIVFDRTALSHINSLLPEIHIPTWIKRAIPVLGKASFGRLKADEWRNLFTLQLLLILPTYWNNGDPASQSLLHNFSNLVSLVTLALKRSMNHSSIEQYRHHIHRYIESSLLLFPDVTLAPNHHMAFHLADCLKKFGPCRAWWSFSMERLMAQVLKSSGNNRLGELEITCQTNYGRMSNLRSLLENKFPPSVEPVICQIKALYDPIPFTPQTQKKNPTTALANHLFKQLFIPVNDRAQQLNNFSVDEVVFSTFETNRNNAVIALKPNAPLKYAVIKNIFRHTRSASDGSRSSDTWLVVQPLAPVPVLTIRSANCLTMRSTLCCGS